jgi:hypothetical protein
MEWLNLPQVLGFFPATNVGLGNGCWEQMLFHRYQIVTTDLQLKLETKN